MCDKKINLILIIFIKKVAIYYVYVCDEQSLISLYVDKKIYLMLQIRLVNLTEKSNKLYNTNDLFFYIHICTIIF